MREILFRGKLKNTGEWAFGNLNITIKGTNIITPDDTPIGKYGAVIPETVGQYTGITEIFEGDIGRYKQTDGAKINGKPIICIGKVVYNEKTASFAVDSKDEIGAKNYDYFPIKDFEIIGNIHDNPELLKGGAKND